MDRVLTRLGFQPKRDRTCVTWSVGKERSLSNIVIVERGTSYTLQTLSLHWNINAVLKTLQIELASLWGRNIRMSHRILSPRTLSLVVEISETPTPSKKPTPRINPPTVIGWTFKIASEDHRLKLFFEDFQVLGLTAPSHWLADLIQATSKSVLDRAYRNATCRSIHELECSAVQTCLLQLDAKLSQEDLQLLDAALQEQELPFIKSTWTPSQTLWSFTYRAEDQGESNEIETVEVETQSIEILETRAAGEMIRTIDHAIINRKPEFPQIKGNTTIALKRKLIHFLQTGDSDLRPEDIESYIQESAYSSAKGLATSALLRMYYQEKNYEKALDSLRLWIEQARTTHGELETIEALNVVLPEFAGVLLAPIAPLNSMNAFERALRSSEEPRILARMVDLAKSMEAVEQELALLERWRLVERRIEQLERIISRQVALQMNAGDTSTAAKNLEYLVVKHSERIVDWLPFVEALADANHPQKALSILERIERHFNQKKNANITEKIAVNVCIARIWDRHLGRIDLALPRYAMILELGDAVDESLVAEAENAMERSGDLNGSLLNKFRRWKSLPETIKSASLEIGIQILKQARELGDIDTEFAVTLDLLNAQHHLDDLAERINAWGTHSLAWRQLLVAVSNAYPIQHTPPSIARAASKLARDKLGDHESAIQFLLLPGLASQLNESEFYYILDRLTVEKRSLELEAVVLDRLKAVRPEARLVALKYLVKHVVIDQDGSIHHALIEDWLDRRVTDLIVDRWNSLIDDSQMEQAKSLLGFIERDLLPTVTIKALVEDLMEATLMFPPDQTDDLLKTLIRLDVEINEHATPSVQRAAYLLASGSDPKAAAPYLKVLLDRDVTIELADPLVHRSLGGESDSLVKFNLQRIKSDNAQNRDVYARNAVELIKRSFEIDSYTLPVIEHLIHANIVRPDDLSLVRSFATTLDRPKLLVDSLLICAHASNDQEAKHRFLLEASELAELALNDPVFAFKILEDVVDTKLPSADVIRLAKLAHKANLPERYRQIILEFLRSPDCILLPNLVLESCDILTTIKEERALIAGIIQTLMSWAQTAQAVELQARLTHFSIIKGLASPQEVSSALVAALDRGDVGQSAAYLIRVFERAESESETLSEVVTSTKSVLVQLGFDNYWWQLIGEMLHGASTGKISLALRKELLCQYGLWLYEQDGRQTEAIKTLLVLSKENPKDRRIWIPVYILLEELQDWSAQISHLENIIPPIELDPSILNQYPIHVETLKASLKRARERAQPNSQAKKDLFSRLSTSENLVKGEFKVQIPAVNSALFSQPTESLVSRLPSPAAAKEIARAPAITPPTGDVFSEVGNAAALLEPSSALPEPESVTPVAGLSLAPDFAPESEQPEFREKSDVRFIEPEMDAPATLNWRTMALTLEAPREAAEILVRTAFASEAEKHIAIQVAALLCGDVASLDNWHWRVWRESSEFGYPLSGKDRIPKLTDLTLLNNPVHRFLSAFAPAVARQHRDRFSITDYLRSKNPMSRLSMRELKLSDPVLQRTGLRHHVGRIEQAHITFVDTPELGDEVFLDASSRAIHFSVEACLAKPPGYLMHRAMGLIWSMQLQYHVILRTDPRREIEPLYQMFLNYNSATPLERIRLAFSTETGKIQKLTQGLNVEKLTALAQQAGALTPQNIQDLQLEMTRHIYRILLAESLDLIGIFEAVTGEIITTLDRRKTLEFIRRSEVLKDLLRFCNRLFL